ncbi:tRNA1(Val) (adenine(37)-N6)-methyltransferase [Yoonia sp.]|uniref:tRNA1(Val) (adenine(37)-N6)-methyltransferase n=1 Tax=Yoonia sp. TaxID=2212373 RepID=UPI002FDA43BF
MTDELTQDAFLGGRLHVWQPRKGYRAGVDPVLLAAAVPARAGDTVLELGCGVGTAALCLAARVTGVAVTGVEVQPQYADLARRNARENKADVAVVAADLAALPDDLRQRQFSFVIMNPPYFDRRNGTEAADAGRDIALGGCTPLATWLDVGIRRIAAKGHLVLIQRIERLPEVLDGIRGRLGSVVVCPIAGRTGKPPDLFLLMARQDGRAPFRMTAPLVLHEGATHDGDRESYTQVIRDVLRKGADLTVWD